MKSKNDEEDLLKLKNELDDLKVKSAEIPIDELKASVDALKGKRTEIENEISKN